MQLKLYFKDYGMQKASSANGGYLFNQEKIQRFLSKKCGDDVSAKKP
jgi:hypothetical protein